MRACRELPTGKVRATDDCTTQEDQDMRRFHVHVAVEDLEANIRFYSTVFGQEPTVRKDDYAKWMVEDPRPA